MMQHNVSEKKEDKTKPSTNTDTDIIKILVEAPQCDIPLSINLWCK